MTFNVQFHQMQQARKINIFSPFEMLGTEILGPMQVQRICINYWSDLVFEATTLQCSLVVLCSSFKYQLAQLNCLTVFLVNSNLHVPTTKKC